ncbi:copper resistance system multicopper oxidase [Acinetobacter ursingii]|uniref:copper resistance system multicopper oxidase n=1 Tax=Acinetobacter ursingii TaxID=108980 RepID=UPI0024494103|nr:copper resistance system multicopper oxidase [Acinetobacter ursingii]MDG9861041.1 copper resistance system multicopper oxidase [Acinetobacter ursingii]MDG9894652.1 copper resistance system multicopper oxidase [Acinetobacter ursingii]MDH0008137.1 copper resistance system multicopper oxidase [Acinetobacter ursingii]MDH0479927.1 copper resistance system multicopper oxidase [Acinetobacter ursingii]MDH2120539.1 copper resistance system multicopper oxidase [Acinetobacter ursingii]
MSILLKNVLFTGLCLAISPFSLAVVKEYHLDIAEKTVNITGKPVQRITVNGQFPAPKLEFEEGDEAVIHVHNSLKNQDSSIHWHGLLLPGIMDGVPGFNGFQGIKPDGSFEYRFKIRQNGTYWYHAHSKGQEQDGLYGAFIVYPKDNKPLTAQEQTKRDYVVMLSDFHDSSSETLMKNLKKSAEYYQNQRETLGDVLQQVKQQGLKATWQDRKMWNQMRMLKTDLSDVTGYTFLVNGKTPEQNWTGEFTSGEKVRLRFINASAMSFFDVRIPNLKMTVVSADGQAVKPVPVDEFRIGTAETYDVIVEPKAAHYQIQAESIDRSGFALASLQNVAMPAPQQITIPDARPRALLTMQDMGHGNMSDSSEHTDHAAMSMPMSQKMSHTSEPSSTKLSSMPDMSEHMDHDAMSHKQMTQEISHQQMTHQEMMQHETSHPQTLFESKQTVQGWANASTPQGAKALRYQDLQSLTPQTDTRQPTKELVIRLGGNMERYIWTMNGKKYNEAEPLQVKYGERIRLKFINDSMMAHPMHLHGMFVQLENGQSIQNLPNKHTLIVPPGKTVTALLTADELGEWAIHCHLLYHMSAGMMNKLIVAKVDQYTLPKVLSENTEQPVQGDQHAHH